METLLIVLLVITVVVAAVVFSPVMIAVDSRHRQVSVRWLHALEFQAPLPGTAGPKRLTIFRRPVRIGGRQPGAKAAGGRKEKPSQTAAESRQTRRKSRKLGRFLARCLGDSHIRGKLARQVGLLLRRTFHFANLTRSEIDISMPDPAFNGMLAGALAAAKLGEPPRIRVNFRDENSLLLELRVHPHRVIEAGLFFLAGLPHRALFRQWRIFAAAQQRGIRGN